MKITDSERIDFLNMYDPCFDGHELFHEDSFGDREIYGKGSDIVEAIDDAILKESKHEESKKTFNK